MRLDRIGTNGTVSNIAQNTFDDDGELIQSIDALNQVTLHTNYISGDYRYEVTTRTNAGVAVVRTERYFRDGTLESVTGNGVHGMRYEYGPTNGGTFTKTIHLNTNGTDSSEWTIQFSDLLGRPYKLLYADGNFSQTFYNTIGQVSKEVDPDGVTTLYFYNALGEREYTVLDLKRNGTLDLNGTNRVTRTLSFATNNVHGDVIRTETWIWPTNSADSAVLASVHQTSTDGHHTWSSSFEITNQTHTYFAGGGTVWTTNIAPDGSFTLTRSDNGRVISTTRKDSTGSQIGATTFDYDEFARQARITDARNGTTTNVFDALDRVVATHSPAPASGQASQVTRFRYDRMGRVDAVTNADNTVTFKEFFDTGELKKTWGSRTYPVEYTYDYSGRMKTMKTWQDFAGNSGTAVTTWNYDAYRGFMTNKAYADGKGPSYRYTPAGRLYLRTWARGVMTAYGTNSAGDIVLVIYSDSTPGVTNTFDRLGRKTQVQDGIGTHGFIYDLAGRLLIETNSAGLLSGIAVTNAYDSLGRRVALGMANEASTLTRYGYDAASRLSSVTNGTNVATYSYLANSPLVSQTLFALDEHRERAIG